MGSEMCIRDRAEEDQAKAEAALIAAEETGTVDDDGLVAADEVPTRMEVECPENSGPGDLILIEGPDGEEIEVIVPDGVDPGELFEYDLGAGTGTGMHDARPESPAIE